MLVRDVTVVTVALPEMQGQAGAAAARHYSLPHSTTTFTVRYKDYWAWYPDGYAAYCNPVKVNHPHPASPTPC